MRKFEQIHLADMEHGLAKLLAIIALTPKEISDLTGVVFETAYEAGFDYFLGALLIDKNNKQFSLRQYYRIRRKYPNQTELIGSERSTDSSADLTDFLEALGINKEYLLWRI